MEMAASNIKAVCSANIQKKKQVRMEYTIRRMRKEEYGLLRDFLYEAVFVPDGVEAPQESILNCPELQVYISDFGTDKNDKALAAEASGKIVGVIWARIMKDYGHIDEDTPSLAMSVLKEYRKEAVRNVRRTKGKLNLEELIQRDNFGIAEKNLERPETQETPLPDDSWMYEA